MTSRSKVDLDSVVRGIVSPREWREPKEEFLNSARSYLERMGSTLNFYGIMRTNKE